MNTTVRNILIVLAIAAVVALIQGGVTAANVAIQAVTLAFLGTLVWFASLSYRERRVQLYSLGDRRRALLYVALGVAALTLTATSRLLGSGAGSVAWLLLLGGSAAVVRRRRIGVLGSEPVPDAHRRQPRFRGQAHETRVLHVVLSQRPAAAVKMQEDAPGTILGRQHPQRHRSRRPLDLERPRLGQEHGCGIDPAPLPPCLPRLHRRDGVDRRHRGQQPFELSVESPSLREQLFWIAFGHARNAATQGPLAA